MVNTVALSVYVLLGTFVVPCLYDLFAFLRFGNARTFSWIILGIEARFPIFALPLSYCFGLLEGHLCLPSIVSEPAVWLTLARLIGVTWPILLGLYLIFRHPTATAARLQWLSANRWRVACFLILGNAVGVVTGSLAVPQHLAAG